MLLDELLSQGYLINERLRHSEIIPFVQKNLARRTPASIVYIGINLAILIILVLHFVRSDITVDNSLSGFGLGVFLTFMLVPIHELVHGLVYKAFGASEVKYKANFRRLVFYAMADKFVTSANQLRIVAIAPFFFITVVLIVLLPFTNGSMTFCLLGILLFHTGACSGDFGLMSYLDTQERGMITFDDESQGETYFLTRPAKS